MTRRKEKGDVNYVGLPDLQKNYEMYIFSKSGLSQPS